VTAAKTWQCVTQIFMPTPTPAQDFREVYSCQVKQITNYGHHRDQPSPGETLITIFHKNGSVCSLRGTEENQ